MAAANYDFEIEQGATLSKSFVWKDGDGVAVNLTGYTARMQIRPSVDSATVLQSLSTTDGTIVIAAVTGTITLTLTDTVTAAITWRRGKYDLELVSSDGTVTRLIYGVVTISKEVTR